MKRSAEQDQHFRRAASLRASEDGKRATHIGQDEQQIGIVGHALLGRLVAQVVGRLVPPLGLADLVLDPGLGPLDRLAAGLGDLGADVRREQRPDLLEAVVAVLDHELGREPDQGVVRAQVPTAAAAAAAGGTPVSMGTQGAKGLMEQSHRTQTAWNVPRTSFSTRSGPTSTSSRARISAAALLVNVTETMSLGATPCALIRCAMRDATTRVLPEAVVVQQGQMWGVRKGLTGRRGLV